MNYIEEAKDILSVCLFIPKETIDSKADIESMKAIDSLSFELLVLEIESRIGREIDPLAFLDLRSVEDLAAILRSQ